MRQKITYLLVVALLPLCLCAQVEEVAMTDTIEQSEYYYYPPVPIPQETAQQETAQQEFTRQETAQQEFTRQETTRQNVEQQAPKEQQEQQKNKSDKKVYTGFSSGMILHAGYLFSDSPDKLFSNNGLGSEDYVKGLPSSGFCMGIGAMLRVHLLDHIHLGAETHISTMPLMKTGSNLRTIWGGAHCDFYTQWGKVRPLIGMTVGGGTIKRLFVPDKAPIVTTQDSTLVLNASYTRTPFFLLDPYIGMEIALGKSQNTALLLRIDYMLQFGTAKGIARDVSWSNFITPSGPRLYVGLLFGNMKKKNKN